MTPGPRRIALALLFAAAFAMYAITAARTITWWDGSHYPLLAATLSITNPPGSLLLTVLGWLWTRVVWASSFAFQLNLLSAAFGAATVTLLAVCVMRVTRERDGERLAELLAGVAAGAWLMTALELWTHATQFTPYGLSALFTALLLWAFVRWWQRAESSDDVAGLALLAFLLGLDVSVHRTNQLLAPALLIGVLLRTPRATLQFGVAGPALAAYVTGIATQLGYIALSARHPVIDLGEMRTPADVLRYVRLDQLGGGFLVNVWPRKASLLHVQLADWVRFLWVNVGTEPVTRLIAMVSAMAGAVLLWRRSPRLASSLMLLFLCAGFGAVVFFNRPVEYMRSLDRHYLPSLVLLVLFVGAGLHAALRSAFAAMPAKLRSIPALTLLLLVSWNIAGNWKTNDLSHTRYAETFGRDLLEPLPPDAILFTNGDNDTFPLLYLQQAEGVRRDVLVANIPLLYAPPQQRRVRALDSSWANLSFDVRPIAALVEANQWRRPVYLAVTGATGTYPELNEFEMELEGLAYRLRPLGSDAEGHGPLTRFVHDRLPRVGLRDARQRIDPEMQSLLSNYAYVGLQLLPSRLLGEGPDAAQKTLGLLEREFTGVDLGPMEQEFRNRMRQWHGLLEGPDPVGTYQKRGSDNERLEQSAGN